MQALDLDFNAQGRRSPWIGRALLAGALLFGGHVFISYLDAREQVADGEARLARLQGEGSRAAPAPNASSDELKEARETVERLSLPWGNLFQALEAAVSRNGGDAAPDVSLLSIEPDARSGTALIGGEARDFSDVLAYVARLSSTQQLRDVHLVRHEIQPLGGRRPVTFTVSAKWKDAR